MVVALVLRTLMNKMTLREFLLALVIFWQALKLRKLRFADDNGHSLVHALQLALEHRPRGAGWKLAFGFRRGTQDCMLSDFTLPKVNLSLPLL